MTLAPSWCPRRCGRPSRRVLVNTSGAAALCVPCHLAGRSRQVGRRLPSGRLPPRLPDNEAARIEKAYAKALKALRPYRRMP